MIICALDLEIERKAKEIHDNHYKGEFKFPDFTRNFYCSFGVFDNHDQLVVTAGVKPIAELIYVTNKDLSVRTRLEALNQALDFSKHIVRQEQLNQLHAFVQDSNWEKQLLSHGFNKCAGSALFINTD